MKPAHAFLALVAGVGFVLTPAAAAEPAATNPAPARAVAGASTPAPAASVNFDALEISGISSFGGESMVCVSDPTTRSSVWLRVGRQTSDLWVERLDSQRDVVALRFGERSRMVGLRKGTITPIPVARMPDGTIDHIHMNMTEEQKAQEAQMLMWDILEVGRLARAGRLPGSPEGKP